MLSVKVLTKQWLQAIEEAVDLDKQKVVTLWEHFWGDNKWKSEDVAH